MNDEQIVELLNRHSKNALNELARTWELTVRPRDRKNLAQALVRQMAHPDQVRKQVDKMGETQRALLRHIQTAGGSISTAALQRQALREKLVKPSRTTYPGHYYLPQQLESGTFMGELVPLMRHGLVLSPGEPRYGSQYLDLTPRTELLIPTPILAALPPIPTFHTNLEGEPPSQVLAGDAGLFQRDLYLYWSYLRDNAVGMTRQGLVSKTHLKRINGVLTQSDALDNVRDETQAGRLRFLRIILHGCQLVRVDQDQLVPAPDSEAFFTRPLAERVRTAFEVYRQTRAWDELLRVPHLSIQGRRVSDTNARPFVIKARQIILRHLAEHVGESWQDVARLREYFFRRYFEFLLPRQTNTWSGTTNPYSDYGNSMGWTFQITELWRSPQGHERTIYSGALPEEQTWEAVEGSFIEAVLREPLSWLGLIDKGIESADTTRDRPHLYAFRLNEQGLHILQGRALPEHAEPEGGRLIVQPTFEVLAYPPVKETHLALLDRIAERAQLDQAAAYRLTRESIYRARQQYDMSIDDVIATLERESGASLPQNVAYTLHEWGRAFDRVTMHDDVLLIQADAELLDRLAAQDATLLVRRLTSTAALVARDAHSRVEETLFAMGSLPVVHTGPPVFTDHPVAPQLYLHAEPDGLLRFRAGAPRLYLKRALALFTAEAGPDLRVTQAQVHQAVHDGMPVERIIAQLEQCCGGALPTALEQAIKVWGGFFGSARVERPLLLCLSDQRTLDGLRDDPEIAALLQPYQPAEVLVQINPDDLPRLRDLFAARGIDLEDPQAPADV